MRWGINFHTPKSYTVFHLLSKELTKVKKLNHTVKDFITKKNETEKKQ